MLATMIVFVVLDDTMYGQINSEDQEQYRADVPEPFFEGCHLARQVTNAHRAVTYQPRNQHNRYTGTQAEHHRHQPVPTARKGQRNIDHRQEIHQTVRTESDREEYTENERPEPTLLAVRLFQPLADSVIMLVVMMTAEKQHNAAYEHEPCQYRLSVVTQHMLNPFRLCAHKERNTQQHVGRQFAQYEHQSVGQHEPFVIDLLVDIADGSYTRHQRTRIQYRQQS